MINKVINILNESKDVSSWLINEAKTESRELFFVKKEINMNRKKHVHHIGLTVYKDFEKDGQKYKGSATTQISPSMTDMEVKEKIESAAYAASFVKNPYFDLVKPSGDEIKQISSAFSEGDIFDYMPKIINALYKNDNHDNGKINSGEVFIEKTNNRIVNSLGVDEEYASYSGEIELVIDWMETGEEIEVIEIFNFSDLDEAKIEKMVADAFDNAKNRAIAKPITEMEGTPVVLTGESVKEFLSIYVTKASAEMVYKQYSQAKVGECLQGEDITGDSVNIKLLPELKNSIASKYIDADGIKLKELSLYENGVLKSYFGDNRHSQYLGIEATGKISNIQIAGGSKSKDELLSGKCLELIAFSDFQMNPLTGDFGGEIRLAKFHDGDKIVPITGGSITGNIKNVQKDMLLSSEVHTLNNCECPVALKLFGATLAN